MGCHITLATWYALVLAAFMTLATAKTGCLTEITQTVNRNSQLTKLQHVRSSQNARTASQRAQQSMLHYG
jgi:ABC-type transporter MlaC component